MEWILWLLVVCIMLLVFTLYIGCRNDEVCTERCRVIKEIGCLSADDSKAGRDWWWRFKAFEEITYNQMLYTFWVPVDKFYKDHKCLQPKDEPAISQPCEGQQV